MKVLVFGSRGMLGTALTQHLESVGEKVYRPAVDITEPEDVEHAFREVSPDVAINCAGVVKSECHNPELAVAVNARAPHFLADVAGKYAARFIHVSTDCVFNGRDGNYREIDLPDAEDLYGQTKAAGEIADRENCLTIRTSFIGYDPRRRRGLLEWLCQSTGAVPGYTRALWSGLSAPELSVAIALAISRNISGLYHVSGPSISKADLLEVLVRELGLRCRIERLDEPVLNRTMNSDLFREATGYAPPSWESMAKELAGSTV